MTVLSVLDAYRAMQLFLEDYHRFTGSDDVGALLGGLQLLADGSSADPAAWSDWLNCVQRVTGKGVSGDVAGPTG